MSSKFSAAWRMLRREGVSAVVRRFGWYINKWYTSDNWWIGRLVEVRGNRAMLDGCHFDLSSPVIGTAQKAGFFWGNYETGERQVLDYLTTGGLALVELGGSIGAMACISSRHFGNPAQHIVVEANPNLIPVLTRNRDLNGCRFTIVHAAVAYGTSEVPFHVHSKFVKSSLLAMDEQTQTVSVPTITLGQIFDRHNFNQIVLFCDIEGAEIDLFQHEWDVIAARVKYLSLEVHPYLTGTAAVDDLQRRLNENGFRQLYNRKQNYLFINDRL